jgi:hypothetical protein
MPRKRYDPVLPKHVEPAAFAARLDPHRRQLAAFDPVKRQAPPNGHGAEPSTDYLIAE